MHRPSAALLGSFLLFALCYSISFFAIGVSPETSLRHFRELFQVKQGMSDDRQYVLFQRDDAPRPPVHLMHLNRGGKVRVWSGASPDKAETVFFIEEAAPRRTYELHGTFLVLPDTVHLVWKNDMTFIFCGTDWMSVDRWFAVDLHAGTVVPLSSPLRCTAKLVRYSRP